MKFFYYQIHIGNTFFVDDISTMYSGWWKKTQPSNNPYNENLKYNAVKINRNNDSYDYCWFNSDQEIVQ